MDPAGAGPVVTDPVRLPAAEPGESDGVIAARIVWIDRFGNLVTNLERANWEKRLTAKKISIKAGELRLDRLSATFGEVAPGEPVAYWGSAGRLEIALRGASAAAATGLAAGADVIVKIRSCEM
jgi:S-adenosylmethionine hydrolase